MSLHHVRLGQEEVQLIEAYGVALKLLAEEGFHASIEGKKGQVYAACPDPLCARH
jgi:hypothetical protein